MRYYWSNDKVLDPSVKIIARDFANLDYFNEAGSERARINVPKGTKEGSYYIFFDLDFKDEHIETDENNNVALVQIDVVDVAVLPYQTDEQETSAAANKQTSLNKMLKGAVQNTNIESDIIKVFPNPVASEFIIDLGENVREIYTAQIIDVSGKYYWSKRFSQSSLKVQCPELKAGVNILLLKNNDGVFAQKKIQIL